MVARRPRWRSAALLSGLTCEGRHVTDEHPMPHPCGRTASCPYCYYQVCRRDSYNRQDSRAVAWQLMQALGVLEAMFVGGDMVKAVFIIARRLRDGCAKFGAVALDPELMPGLCLSGLVKAYFVTRRVRRRGMSAETSPTLGG